MVKTNQSKDNKLKQPELKVSQQRSSSRIAAIKMNQADDLMSFPSFTGSAVMPIQERKNNRIEQQPSYVIRRSNSLWKQEKSQSDILPSSGGKTSEIAKRNAVNQQQMKNAFIINDDELNKMQTLVEQQTQSRKISKRMSRTASSAEKNQANANANQDSQGKQYQPFDPDFNLANQESTTQPDFFGRSNKKSVKFDQSNLNVNEQSSLMKMPASRRGANAKDQFQPQLNSQFSMIRPMDSSYSPQKQPSKLQKQYSLLGQKIGKQPSNIGLTQQFSFYKGNQYPDAPSPAGPFSFYEQKSLVGGFGQVQNYRGGGLGLEKRSSSQDAREENQMQKMLTRQEKKQQNQFEAYNPISAGINLGKRTSTGIRDDESLLCPTPPERDIGQVPMNQQMFMGRPQINVQVNIDANAFQNQGGYIDQSSSQYQIDQHNRMMMQKFHDMQDPYQDNKNEDTGKFDSVNRTSSPNKQSSAYRKKRDSKAQNKQLTPIGKQQSNDSILKQSQNGDRQSPDTETRRKTRGLGKKTQERKNSMALDKQLTVIKKKSTTVQNLSCKCSKSKCLKMYCECFTLGRFCDESCNCVNCHNTEQNEKTIKDSRKNIRNRNPLAFKPKVQNVGPHRLFQQDDANQNPLGSTGVLDVRKQASKSQRCTKQANISAWHINGCRCKRSNCQKKYCECFQMGVLCKPDKCQCCDCKNTKEEVERRMVTDDFLNEFADMID